MAGSKAISFEMFLGKIGFRFCVEENKNEILGPKIVKKTELTAIDSMAKEQYWCQRGKQDQHLKG